MSAQRKQTSKLNESFDQQMITDQGYELLAQGSCGNAGENLYVSRKGVLQRIQQFDLTGNGYIDLPLVNSHDDDTRVPVYIYTNPLQDHKRIELPTNGAYASAVGELTDSGYSDIVIANQYNGVCNEVHAQIYYGSEEGWSNKYAMQLWAPSCKDVVIGDFNGDGRADLAFISREQLRIFYQTKEGFQSNDYVDLPLLHDLESMTAVDWDQDGYVDLIIRSSDQSVRVYWGNKDGISAERFTLIAPELTGCGEIAAAYDLAASGAGAGQLVVYGVPAVPRLKFVTWRNRPHLFISRENETLLLCLDSEKREAQCAFILDSGPAFSIAIGDTRGNGAEDIVVATRETDSHGNELTWIYYENEQGYSKESRSSVVSKSANDVALCDLNGNGYADLIICQDKTVTHYSTESLIYAGSSDGFSAEPIRLSTHCAQDMAIVSLSKVKDPIAGYGVMFLNHLSNRVLGDVPTYFYLGGPDGFHPDRRMDLPSWAATEVKIADVDDDGYPDVFIANCNENAMHLDNGSYVYYGGPDGFSTEKRVELPTTYNMSGCIADLNQDGYLDIVTVGHANDEMLIFYGSESGFTDPNVIKLHFDGEIINQPRFMTLGDFNNNGWLDILIPNCGDSGYSYILWGGPEGYSNERFTALATGPTISSRAADLNGNGWLDLIIGGLFGDDPGDRYRSFVYIYWGGPEGYSNARRTQLPAYFASDIAIADFNNDGILDLFVSNYHASRTRDLDSFIYWGTPEGEFTEKNSQRLFHHSASGVLAADFNEDGYIDLAVVNHKTNGNHPGDSYVWWNGPEGFSEKNRTSLPTLGPHGITHSDIGNIMDRSPEEYYESRAIEVPEGSRVTGISWNGEVPHKTWVKAQLRFAEQQENLQNASWAGPDGEGTWFEQENGAALEHDRSGRWVQYRLALGATNSCGTPRIDRVDITLELLEH